MSPHAARQRTMTVLSVVVTAVILAGYLAFSSSPIAIRARGLVGETGRISPEVSTDSTGAFEFMAKQRGTDEPVGFSPCREISYAVDPTGAPPGWRDDVDFAIDEVSRRTGLRFADEGTTDDRDFGGRVLARTSARPVIIGWADAAEVPALAGDVAGLGGATMVEVGSGLRSYVSGSVVLDTQATDRFAADPDGAALHRALLLHELGHLVGLDHVDDPDELMYADGLTRPDYGPGDRQGLARLGAIAC